MDANFWEYSKEYHETRVFIEAVSDEQLMLNRRHGFQAENPLMESLYDQADEAFQLGRRLESQRKPRAASWHFRAANDALYGLRIETRREYAGAWITSAGQTLTDASGAGDTDAAFLLFDRARDRYREARALSTSKRADTEQILDTYDRACNLAIRSIHRTREPHPARSHQTRGTLLLTLFLLILLIGLVGSFPG